MSNGEPTVDPPLYTGTTYKLDLVFEDDATDDPYFLQASPPDDITITIQRKEGDTQTELGSLSGGEIVVTGDGTARLTVAYTATGGFCTGTYRLGMQYEDGGEIEQVFFGHISVREGL